jgi:hypothetical protein
VGAVLRISTAIGRGSSVVLSMPRHIVAGRRDSAVE